MHTEVMGRRHIDEDQNERGPYWAVQAPSTRQSRASDLRGSVRTQEYRERTDLPPEWQIRETAAFSRAVRTLPGRL